MKIPFCGREKGLGHDGSTSTVDLDLDPGSETECRGRSLGGTREVNVDECFMETPMMSAANQTGDSSCPLWLQKVCYKCFKVPLWSSF